MTYDITWDTPALNSAARFLKDDPEGLRQLFDAVEHLAQDPRPDGSVPYGSESLRRVYVGRYRAIYEINDTVLTILVLQTGRIP